MRSDGVLVPPPPLDNDLGLLQGVEDFAIQKFIPQLGDEALAITVLPRAAGHDVRCLGAHSRDPFTQCLSDELRTVVGSDVAWDAPQNE